MVNIYPLNPISYICTYSQLRDELAPAVSRQPWYKDKAITLTFPTGWEVQRCKMACEGQKGLAKAQIRNTVRHPLSIELLVALADKKYEAVIIFDNMTCPTKIYQYAQIILEELKKAGIRDKNMRFFFAAGSHGTFDRLDFVKKLGEDLVDRYPMFKHNPL